MPMCAKVHKSTGSRCSLPDCHEGDHIAEGDLSHVAFPPGASARWKRTLCSSCKMGEQGYEAEDGILYLVRELDSGRILFRGYLCDEHHSMYLDDGYSVTRV